MPFPVSPPVNRTDMSNPANNPLDAFTQPPANALQLYREWLSLIEEIDELSSCEGYIGEADRGKDPRGTASGPLFDRLWDIDKLLEGMEPSTVDATTLSVLRERRAFEGSQSLYGGKTAWTRLMAARAFPSGWGRA